MDSQNEMKLFSKPDWRWVGVSYCMFVVFHLLPSVIMIGLFRGVATPGLDIGTAVWMFWAGVGWSICRVQICWCDNTGARNFEYPVYPHAVSQCAGCLGFADSDV